MGIVDFTKFKLIAIEKLVKAPWNYKEDNEQLLSKLIEGIKRVGQVENIQVRLLPTGFYEVVNGNHRLDAFAHLGVEQVICYDHGTISESEAKLVAINTNELHFATDHVKHATIMDELIKELSIEQLVPMMPYDETQMKHFQEVCNFDWNKFDQKTQEDQANSEGSAGSSRNKITITLSDEEADLWETVKEDLEQSNDKAALMKLMEEFQAARS